MRVMFGVILMISPLMAAWNWYLVGTRHETADLAQTWMWSAIAIATTLIVWRPWL